MLSKKVKFMLKCNDVPAPKYLIIVGVESECIPKVLKGLLVFTKLTHLKKDKKMMNENNSSIGVFIFLHETYNFTQQALNSSTNL